VSPVRTLLLVRHGLPDYRLHQAGDEPPGPPLSDIGFLQARQTAGALRPYEPTTIYCSPLARARQTADCFGGILGLPVAVHSALQEWHRTESLYDVSVRSASWLARWVAGAERCVVVVGHASPLLAVIRTALYLPHFGWWKRGHPDQPEIDTCDRFELSMGSVYALTFAPERVTAEVVFHPEPRIVDTPCGRPRRCFPRPNFGDGEGRFVCRPAFVRLAGWGLPAEGI